MNEAMNGIWKLRLSNTTIIVTTPNADLNKQWERRKRMRKYLTDFNLEFFLTWSQSAFCYKNKTQPFRYNLGTSKVLTLSPTDLKMHIIIRLAILKNLQNQTKVQCFHRKCTKIQIYVREVFEKFIFWAFLSGKTHIIFRKKYFRPFHERSKMHFSHF